MTQQIMEDVQFIATLFTEAKAEASESVSLEDVWQYVREEMIAGSDVENGGADYADDAVWNAAVEMTSVELKKDGVL